MWASWCRLVITQFQEFNIALCNIKSCCRDIVEGLNVASCTRQGDFEWQRQLRTYYHVEDDTLQVKQVSC